MTWIFLASLLLLSSLAETSYGGILLSSLPNTLDVAASPHQPDQFNTPNGTWYMSSNIKAGEDILGVRWSLNNRTFPVGTDAVYKTVTVKLCYAPTSQVGRPERKTEDDLDKDQTCQIEFYTGHYNRSSRWPYYESTLDGHVPAALYFLRAYANDSAGVVVAYGESTGPDRDYNIFEVDATEPTEASSGSRKTLDNICFGSFSALLLVGFFVAY
ncbi:high-affinity nitrate transporter 3.2 [Rosa chinensis]|nr:high-affinity nitrate transporter 3.2 [Rosa chinensis]